MIFKWTQDFNVIFAQPTSGKTTMAKKYNNVIDLSASQYAWLDFGTLDPEKGKFQYTQKNPDYPENYISAIKIAAKDKSKIILCPPLVIHDVIQSAHRAGIKFAYAYHMDVNRAADYCRARGNDENFVKLVVDNFDNDIKVSRESAFVPIIINPDEHLEQALARYEQSNQK